MELDRGMGGKTPSGAVAQDLAAVLHPAEIARGLPNRFYTDPTVWEDEKREKLKEVIGSERPRKVALWIGPEGGFTSLEIEELTDRGAKTFSLGERRLKAETAAVASLAVLNELLR